MTSVDDVRRGGKRLPPRPRASRHRTRLFGKAEVALAQGDLEKPRLGVRIHFRRVAPRRVQVVLARPDAPEKFVEFDVRPVGAGLYVTDLVPKDLFDVEDLPYVRVVRDAPLESEAPEIFLLPDDAAAEAAIAAEPTPFAVFENVAYPAAAAGASSEPGSMFFLHLDLLSAHRVYTLDGAATTQIEDYFAAQGAALQPFDGALVAAVMAGLTDVLDAFVRPAARPAAPDASFVDPAHVDAILAPIEVLLALRFKLSPLSLDSSPDDLRRKKLCTDFTRFASGNFAVTGGALEMFNCEPNGSFYFLFAALGIAADARIAEQIEADDGTLAATLAARRDWWRALTLAVTVSLEGYSEVYSGAASTRDSARYLAAFRHTPLGALAWPWERALELAKRAIATAPTWDETLDTLHARLRLLLADEVADAPAIKLDSASASARAAVGERFVPPPGP